MAPVVILQSLPGHLSRNQVEIHPLMGRMTPFSDLVKDCVQSDTDDWSDGQLLCFSCVVKLLGKHLMRWLIQQKVQSTFPAFPLDVTSLICYR